MLGLDEGGFQLKPFFFLLLLFFLSDFVGGGGVGSVIGFVDCGRLGRRGLKGGW